MMSLFVGDKPLGLMYGDGETLNQEGYRQFRELCQEASALTAGSRAAATPDALGAGDSPSGPVATRQSLALPTCGAACRRRQATRTGRRVVVQQHPPASTG